MKVPRYIVIHERVVTRFPWTVIDAESREPALWHNDPKVGKLPRRFRTEALAQAAADKLNAAQPE
jgi:hypothetical protein